MHAPTTCRPTHPSSEGDGAARAHLTIDLDALADNYRLLDRLSGPAACAAVVKANAYGLGVDRVAPVLHAAGCRAFFVATGEEAIELREILDTGGGEAEILVLNGIAAHAAEARRARKRGLVPVLNSGEEVAQWRALGASLGGRPDVALHVDTAMNRLGLPVAEASHLLADPGLYDDLNVTALISHLACAEQAEHPLNRRQCARFTALCEGLPLRASLANSSGIFLGPEYRFDLVRAGVALYGANPIPDRPNPMAEVVGLKGKIIQTRRIDGGMSVGYGAAFTAARPTRLATVPVGYADGYPRALGNRGSGEIGGVRVPVAGRVSMDLTVFDVTGAAADMAVPGADIQLIGRGVPLDEVAEAAGTIAYEILVRLGRRPHRTYLSAADR